MASPRKRPRQNPKGGRPERLPTDDEVKKLCDVISLAATTDKEAYTLADVPRTTFYEWLAKGRAASEMRAAGRAIDKKQKRFLTLWDSIGKARASRTVGLLSRIAVAAKDPKNWQAARLLLGFTEPKRFVERVNVYVGEQLTDALSALKANLSPDEYERALDAIASSDGGARAESDSEPEAGPDDPGDEAVLPPPTGGEAEGVSKPRR